MLARPKKPPKYGNRKTEVDGITFDSVREANRYRVLKLMERSGEISDLQLQVPFVIVRPAKINGRMKPAVKYIADFTYREGSQIVVEDCKGMRTPTYRLKRHLMAVVHGIEIRET